MKNKTKKTKKVPFESFLEENILNFVKHASSLNKTLFTIFVMQKMYEVESIRVEKFIEKRGKNIKNTKGVLLFNLDKSDNAEYEKLKEEAEKSKNAIKVLPRSLLISMVSQFDIFIASLIKEILNRYPGIISSEKKLSVGELKNFKNKNEIIEYFIEKEIDSVLYDNHISHIEWIENKNGIELKKYLGEELSDFIELTERRNLFVHADGIINYHYLDLCKKNKIKLSKNHKKGVSLYVEPNYFDNCYSCLYSISTKITYILWKKLSSDDVDSEKLNTFFNNEICIKLIQEKNYELASSILKFIIDNFKEKTSELFVRIFTINYSLSKKLNDKNNEALKIIESMDWSASNDDLKLAVSIIKGDHEESLRLMEKIGKSGNYIDKESYKSDPLFIPIMKLDKFRKLYKKIFKEEYLSLEQKINPQINQLNK